MSPPAEPGPADLTPGRTQRANIAAQACETCRSRKTRCDEQRPACGLCRRLHLECVYREPQPTKKDKTMVHILESLTRLELKIDRAIDSAGSTNNDTETSRTTEDAPSEQRPEPYKHITAPHKVMIWPAIYVFLANTGNPAAAESQNILQHGTAWFLQQERTVQSHTLPLDGVTTPGDETALLRDCEESCSAYFESFNVLAPILDRQRFKVECMRPAMVHGCRGYDAGTILTWLVLALGHVARDGVFGEPISRQGHVVSGFRGGGIHSPPGLEQFNQARKRLGFVFTDISLQVVQIKILMATYFESSGRHLDFWKSAISASNTVQALIRGQTIDWAAPEGHFLRQSYWACLLNEMFYHHDLDFPQTDIAQFQDIVPAPSYYDRVHKAEDVPGEDQPEANRYFMAMITLRHVISRIHNEVHRSSSDREFWLGDGSGPRFAVIRDVAQQLESWRQLLPGPLQWSDDNRFAFPHGFFPPHRPPNTPLFEPTQPPLPVGHRHNLDIMVAQLRTRYYYAKFMTYRPFIYRALHVGDAGMTPEDDICCGLAIKSALSWPMFLAPPKNKKRLVPHHFTWTQNTVGILLILRMRHENECLRRICEQQINQREMEQSIALMLEWIRDMRQVDGFADWGWRVLEPLYTSAR